MEQLAGLNPPPLCSSMTASVLLQHHLIISCFAEFVKQLLHPASSMSADAADSTQADSAHSDELDEQQAAKRFSLSGYQLNKLPARRLSRSESRRLGNYRSRGVKLYRVSCSDLHKLAGLCSDLQPQQAKIQAQHLTKIYCAGLRPAGTS